MPYIMCRILQVSVWSQTHPVIDIVGEGLAGYSSSSFIHNFLLRYVYDKTVVSYVICPLNITFFLEKWKQCVFINHFPAKSFAPFTLSSSSLLLFSKYKSPSLPTFFFSYFYIVWTWIYGVWILKFLGKTWSLTYPVALVNSTLFVVNQKVIITAANIIQNNSKPGSVVSLRVFYTIWVKIENKLLTMLTVVISIKKRYSYHYIEIADFFNCIYIYLSIV